MKFVKKPVEVDAIRYTGDNDPEISAFMGPKFSFIKDGKKLGIDTLEGTMWASPGDWIIRGIQGEYYPCKPDIFEKTYEQVKEGLWGDQ